jgi:serine/threonine-protein kinase
VAVKVLPIAFSDDRSYLDRFNREAAISASLEHAHIVPVYDYGTDGDVTYVVMRLLTGGNLSERITARREQKQSMPSLPEIADLLKSLAGALDYAHSQQVIHRDIKPTNVMFDNQGSPFLVDFGIAKLMEATTGLTQPGQSPGTPVFMAPEQWKADEIGPATDQYALGILAYLLVTGRVPFDADTPYQIMHKHFYEMPTPPQAHRSDLPEAVTRVLNRVLEKEPTARFPSAADFARAFEHASAGQHDEATNFFVFKLPEKPDDQPTYVAEREKAPTKSTLQSQPTEVIRNKMVWGGLGLVAAVIIVALALIFLLGGDDSTPLDDNLVAMDADATQTAQLETAHTATADAATQIAALLPAIATETRPPTNTASPTLDAREAAQSTKHV